MLHVVRGLGLDGAFKMLQLQAVARIHGKPPVVRSLRIPTMSKAYSDMSKHCLMGHYRGCTSASVDCFLNTAHSILTQWAVG
jgi:hypothetical protein